MSAATKNFQTIPSIVYMCNVAQLSDTNCLPKFSGWLISLLWSTIMDWWHI